MKVKDLIEHSHLVRNQYVTVTDRTDREHPVEYSSQGIGRYDFGPKNQDKVLGLKVNTFRWTDFGFHIDAEEDYDGGKINSF